MEDGNNGDDEKSWEEAVARLFRGRRRDGDVNLGDRGEASGGCCLPLPPPPTSIRHVRQHEHWDCGIACLEMVCEWLGRRRSLEASSGSGGKRPVARGIDRNEIAASLGTRSVWTVDLLLMLDRFIRSGDVIERRKSGDGDLEVTADANTNDPAAAVADAEYLFCSTTLEVNEDLGGYSYYEKSFEKDRVRVADAFDDAVRRRKLPVLRRRRLPLEQVLRLVRDERCVAIALVDNSVLLRGIRTEKQNQEQSGRKYEDPSDNNGTNGFEVERQLPQSTSYSGHYIVLTGVVIRGTSGEEPKSCRSEDSVPIETTPAGEGRDIQREGAGAAASLQLAVCNPASCDCGETVITHVPLELFERAWRANGTDEDIVFVANHRCDGDGDGNM